MTAYIIYIIYACIRYLNNYIKDRGLDVFFLINGWDEIASSLIDPNDAEALNAAEARSRSYFQSKLTEYLIDGDNYDQRVLEISALETLRGVHPSNVASRNT